MQVLNKEKQGKEKQLIILGGGISRFKKEQEFLS